MIAKPNMITSVGILILSLSVTTCISAPVNETSVTSGLMLTSYIKLNQLQKARDASAVNSSLFLNVISHAGYLTVNESYGSNLFFWYFPVAGKPVNETPWIVWLQGGPGASSLAGLFDEIGPFGYDGQLKRREWSWTANYSMLFIDNPVGAGFSFTNSKEGFVTNMKECSNHLYNALQQFLTIFPELRGAPLYIAGESYAGRYVPSFGHKILEQQTTGNATLNLKGLILGNPVIDRIDAANISSVYYHWGLLDTQGLLAAKPLQDQYIQAIKNNDVSKAYELRNKLLNLLDEITQKSSSYNVLEDANDLHKFKEFLNRADVRKALHVGSINFTFSNQSVAEALKTDFLTPLRPKIEKLLEKYKIMVYCGHLDLVAPCELAADSRRRSWHWSGREHFLSAPRRPWTYNGRLAGYVKEGGRFTEALVVRAGRSTPAAARSLLAHFLSGAALPAPAGFADKPEYTPHYTADTDTDQPRTEPQKESSTPLIVSVIVNVLLILCLVGGALLYVRYKRRREAFFYSTVEDSISDGILTMT